MNIRLTHIEDCIKQAQNDLRNCRAERANLLVELSGFTIGQEFERGGRAYKVVSISASEHGREVWLMCRYRLSSGKWSQGVKPVSHKVTM